MTKIFVFGSNLAGKHGRGGAAWAYAHCGAVWGVGIGPKGNSYAIPTKDQHLRTLLLPVIRTYVQDFIKYAVAHPELTFQVTRIGCGLAGYSDIEISPLFQNAPVNCELPDGWRK